MVLSFSWLRGLHIFEAPHGQLTWVLAGLALIIAAFRDRHVLGERLHRGIAVLILLVSITAMLWLGGPFIAGFVCLFLFALVCLIPLPSHVRCRLGPGLWFGGLVLVVQAALVPLLYVFCARYHDTADLPFLHELASGYPSYPWLAALLYLPLKLLNWGTALNGSTLYLPTTLDTLALTPTWEKLGLFPLVLFGAGSALFVLLSPRRRRLVGLIVWLLIYAYVRLLFLFLLVNQFRNDHVFWVFDYMFYSFLPLALILGVWWRLGSSREAEVPARPETGSRPVRYGRVVLGVLLLAGGASAYAGYHDPGSLKEGRILIDERHSDWEWTTQPFDTTWYGGKSGYNFYCLADYWNHYYNVETRSDSLSPEFLSQWDVVVIKTPTSKFSPDEVDAIEEFVRGGGGLFLIGDHTNVFGTSTYINPIAERFGMYFRYDSTYDLPTLSLSLFERPGRFAHPVVQHMPEYLFATSCTMYSPLLSENIMLGYGLRAMYLDYSEHSYFPTKEGKVNYDFGLFVQAGGVKYGKGRVLGYTDSTCFSNFFMFIPGKPELALGSIEWLNRTNRFAWLGTLFLLFALVGLVLLILEGACGTGATYWNTIVVVGTLAVVCVGWLCERAARSWYPIPPPQREIVHVTFDQGHGAYLLPTDRLSVNNWQNFQTFYVWTQRLGLVPRNENTVEEAVRNSRALMEIHPNKPFSIDELDLIIDFVRRGGTLVVMDSPHSPGSTANSLLGPFLLAFDTQPVDSMMVFDERGDSLVTATAAYGLVGGTPLLTLADGRTTMGYTEFGRGKVVACGASYLFSSQSMGSTAVVPDERQKRIFRKEYDLFEKLIGLRTTGRYLR